MANFSTDDMRTLFDSVDGDEFALLGDPLQLGVEETDLFDMAGTLLSSAEPFSGMDLSLSDLCASDSNSPPHSFYESLHSPPQSPMSTMSTVSSAPPSPPRHMLASVKSPMAQVPSIAPKMMSSRKPAGSALRTSHPYDQRSPAASELRGGSREPSELRGGPKRHRKTIQRKRQEQMARLDTLTAAQHELRETVRVAAEEVLPPSLCLPSFAILLSRC